VEAQLNALPQFITEIDGLDFHFVHLRFIYVRSRHENVLPLIVNHGSPGSVVEQLTNPTRRGASLRTACGEILSLSARSAGNPHKLAYKLQAYMILRGCKR
jgi:hypothetical protein